MKYNLAQTSSNEDTIAALLMPCRGPIGKIFGHNFKPRYNTEYEKCKEWGFDDEGDEYTNEAMKIKHQTYIGEVCVRCGCQITRN